MNSTRAVQVTTPGEREIAVRRVLDAPRRLVFEAFTKPELVKRWLLGPDGWSMPVCEIDLRVGGRYRYVWRRDGDGSEMGMGNAFGNGSYGMGWCLPCLDQGLSALLVDLRERGLLERTLVVVMGEFGRTPRINQPNINPGRQHWPNCWSAILAGGGIRGGAVYGETDRIGAYVKDRPVRVQDLGATIYHALNVPLETRLGADGFTNPVSTGTPIEAIF